MSSVGFGGPNWGDRGVAIWIDDSGDLLLTGTFEDEIDFGGGTLTGSGDEDLFLARFDSAGVHQWSMGGGGETTFDHGQAVVTDSSDHVIFTGYFAGTVDFGGGPLTSTGDDWDIFFAQYDSGGNHLWSRRFGAPGWDGAMGLAVDHEDNLIIVGYISGTVDFGGDPLVCNSGHAAFVAKFDSDGNHIWSKSFGD